ncbi:DUF6391 domain-containing protein [Trichocoleus sp. FACHB-262]|uniref:DUF6391 domain-containing protein n=1 Tax=Trichocoleus sp. FACHB-262 TaxID=2692869 RepID=UPI0016849BD9|nr:DUF6391 domain-containing protein [Trichocoleus sp. FACHB-262]MBD2123738.1 hypothetical protein [Trichocoleus sp. FACHB-262]
MAAFASEKNSEPLGFWNPELLNPSQTQDTDLLKQLSFIPALKELLMLRQVHALEHATVWVLSESSHSVNAGTVSRSLSADNELLGGMSTDQGFYLYGQVDTVYLRWSVHQALQRITEGEWNLAVHPRCGTNLSVNMLLTTGLALGIHLLLPKGPIEQLLGLGLAATTAAHLAPDLGSLAQQYVTTAIPFNLAIAGVTAIRDDWGRPAHFVRVHWIE